MSRESNDFSKIRYEYLKGQAFVSKEDVEGFIEAIDEKGLMSYVVFDAGEIHSIDWLSKKLMDEMGGKCTRLFFNSSFPYSNRLFEKLSSVFS